jgi:hypothetical protein
MINVSTSSSALAAVTGTDDKISMRRRAVTAAAKLSPARCCAPVSASRAAHSASGSSS